MKANNKTIIVLGGSGATGRHMLKALRALVPDAQLAVGTRTPQRAGRPDGAEEIHWDADMPSSRAADILGRYRLVVSCLGPSSLFSTQVQQLCLCAGVDCIDVNDDPQTAGRILAFGPEAGKRDIRLFTSMGMNPGLSTYLHHILRERLLGLESREPLGQTEVCVFSGADEDAGLAATHTMLDCLTPRVTVLRDEAACEVAADDSDAAAFFRFPGHGARLFTAQCSSAEPVLLEQAAAYAARFPASGSEGEAPGTVVKNATYRMHFQGMPRGMSNWLRSSALLRIPRVRGSLAGLFHRMHERTRRRPGNLRRSILAIFGEHQTARGVISATGSTVFGMTAAFAATVARIYLDHPETVPAGVHMAHTCWAPPEDVLPLLGELGITVSHVSL